MYLLIFNEDEGAYPDAADVWVGDLPTMISRLSDAIQGYDSDEVTTMCADLFEVPAQAELGTTGWFWDITASDDTRICASIREIEPTPVPRSEGS